MSDWEAITKKLAELMGFRDYRVEMKPEEKRGALFIYDGGNFLKEQLPNLVESLNHIFQMIAKKNGTELIFMDVNNYRQEREVLIAELARAAAKKAVTTKGEVPLPVMNSYERRLVHVALAIHPEVRTESVGEGKERYVIVKPIEDGGPAGSQSAPGQLPSESA
jgi:R3H domain